MKVHVFLLAIVTLAFGTPESHADQHRIGDDLEGFARGIANGLSQSCFAYCGEEDAECRASCDCLAETLPGMLDMSTIADVPLDDMTQEKVAAFNQENIGQYQNAFQICDVPIEGDS